jgi:hypothetical protein
MCTAGRGVLSSGLNRLERESGLSSLSNAGVKNASVRGNIEFSRNCNGLHDRLLRRLVTSIYMNVKGVLPPPRKAVKEGV